MDTARLGHSDTAIVATSSSRLHQVGLYQTGLYPAGCYRVFRSAEQIDRCNLPWSMDVDVACVIKRPDADHDQSQGIQAQTKLQAHI